MEKELKLRLCQLMLDKLSQLAFPAEVSVDELLSQVLDEDDSLTGVPLSVDDYAALDSTFKQLASGSGFLVSSTAALAAGSDALPVSLASIYHKVADIEAEFASVPEKLTADREVDITCYARHKDVKTRYGTYSAFLVRVPSGETSGVRLLRNVNTIQKIRGEGFIEYLRNRNAGCKFAELDNKALVLTDCNVEECSNSTPWFRLKNTGFTDLVVLVEKCTL